MTKNQEPVAVPRTPVLTDGQIIRIANYLMPDSLALGRAIEAKVLEHVSGVMPSNKSVTGDCACAKK